MKIQLHQLTLENFKGTKKLCFGFGAKTEIFGKNESGKTSLMDAFSWLFFGKDSQGKADFELKTTGRDGNVIHNLEHSVEAVLLVNDNKSTFKKVYREKWTKKRGEANKELTGHTTDHFIDGVPIPKKDYDSKVSKMIDEKLFNLLTDARFFNEQMHWTDRRNILTELCGQIDESKIEGFALIKSFLDERSIEDQKKIVSAQKKKINEELKSIPHKIQENDRMITDDQPPQGRLQQGKLRGEQDDYRREITALKNDSGTQERQKKIAEIETEIINKQNSFSSDQQIKLDPVLDKVEVLETKISRLGTSIAGLANERISKKTELGSKENVVQNIRNEWSRIEESQFSMDQKCPVCSQDIPEYMVQDSKNSHNQSKSNKLEELSKKGKELGVEIAKLKTEITDLESQIKEKEDKLPEFNRIVKETKVEQTKINSTFADTVELEMNKEVLLEAIKQQTPPDTSDLESKIQDIDDQIEKERQLLLKVENNKKCQLRMKELEEEEKKLSQEFADLDKQLFQIENFIVSKVGMIESKINGMFKIAKFKMFYTQINGGIEEVCEVMKNGVVYNSINNAGKIQVGIDIINTLQKFYNLSGPIWIDNRESITEIPETDCQTISLFVSPEDNELRVV